MNTINQAQNGISEKALQQIQEQQIKIKPRWQFLLKDYVIWFFSIFCFLIGSVAFSVVLYLTVTDDWQAYKNIGDSFWEFILLSLPYFWIILVILFIFVADYNFKHTNKGYKYQLSYIVVGGILASMLLGTMLFSFGAGRAINNVLSDNLPLYNQTVESRVKLWTQPEKGLLAGQVQEIKSDTTFLLRDFYGNIYEVDYSKATVVPNIEIKKGYKIRIIGEYTDNIFKAQKIMSLRTLNKKQIERIESYQNNLQLDSN